MSGSNKQKSTSNLRKSGSQKSQNVDEQNDKDSKQKSKKNLKIDVEDDQQ